MVIAFGNQKGGCGKSTLCVHFAHYLAAKNENVVVIDADFQETIVKARNQDLKQMEQDSIEVEKEPFGVMGANPNSIADQLDFLFEASKGNMFLVDLAGKLDDAYVPILEHVDAIITPFEYNRVTLDSTTKFVKIVSALGRKKESLFFVPNKIQNVTYASREKINEVLSDYGYITPEVRLRIGITRFNTLVAAEEEVQNVLKPTFDYIYKKIKEK